MTRLPPDVEFCRDDHDYGPAGFEPYRAWVVAKLKTHTQVECPDCRLYVIWRPIDHTPPDEPEQMSL